MASPLKMFTYFQIDERDLCDIFFGRNFDSPVHTVSHMTFYQGMCWNIPPGNVVGEKKDENTTVCYNQES